MATSAQVNPEVHILVDSFRVIGNDHDHLVVDIPLVRPAVTSTSPCAYKGPGVVLQELPPVAPQGPDDGLSVFQELVAKQC